ncbi:MAG: polysaccharide deacetylase family protein [Coprothermobacter sp.]|nr:polysaccharide deacetylase family protein [Coprothermobacter sp.]
MKKILISFFFVFLLMVQPVKAQPLVHLAFLIIPETTTATTNMNMNNTPPPSSSGVIFVDQSKPFTITVDDGYSRPALKKLITLKKQYGASFTCLLFPYGAALKDNEDLFAQLINLGCEVHNHTYHHIYFRHTTAEQQKEEILSTDHVIERVYKLANQKRPNIKYFRPPGGFYDLNTIRICKANGYRIMLWNVITEPNGKNLSVDERARYIYGAPKGSIILLHSKERDMDALSKALPVLLKHYGIPAH